MTSIQNCLNVLWCWWWFHSLQAEWLHDVWAAARVCSNLHLAAGSQKYPSLASRGKETHSVYQRCHWSPFSGITDECTWLRKKREYLAPRASQYCLAGIASQYCPLSATVEIRQEALLLHSEWNCREQLAGRKNTWLSFRELELDLLDLMEYAEFSKSFSQPMQAGNLTAFFRIWGWYTNWTPDGQAVPVTLCTMVERLKSMLWHAAGRLHRPGKLLICVTERGEYNMKEVPQGTGELARISILLLPWRSFI